MPSPDSNRRPIPARNLSLTKIVVARLAARGVTSDQVSLFGLGAGLGSGLALALTSVLPRAAVTLWLLAAGLVGLRGLSNMADGMLAVEHGKGTATGIFFNEVPDRISDIALLAGAGCSLGGSPAAGWRPALRFWSPISGHWACWPVRRLISAGLLPSSSACFRWRRCPSCWH